MQVIGPHRILVISHQAAWDGAYEQAREFGARQGQGRIARRGRLVVV
jgi:hypothetical protein